jgi:hypothetical protein
MDAPDGNKGGSRIINVYSQNVNSNFFLRRRTPQNLFAPPLFHDAQNHVSLFLSCHLTLDARCAGMTPDDWTNEEREMRSEEREIMNHPTTYDSKLTTI